MLIDGGFFILTNISIVIGDVSVMIQGPKFLDTWKAEISSGFFKISNGYLRI